MMEAGEAGCEERRMGGEVLNIVVGSVIERARGGMQGGLYGGVAGSAGGPQLPAVHRLTLHPPRVFSRLCFLHHLFLLLFLE